jgi:hypothetical protein
MVALSIGPVKGALVLPRWELIGVANRMFLIREGTTDAVHGGHQVLGDEWKLFRWIFDEKGWSN